MTISLSIFYFLYLALIAVCLLFIFFLAYTYVRFGLMTLANALVLLFFLGVAAAILFITWEFTSQIDWQQTITLQLFSSNRFF